MSKLQSPSGRRTPEGPDAGGPTAPSPGGNNEFRFPAYRFLDGVAFFDAGNVYRHIEDFSLSGVRTSAGAGLRIRTPYALIRLDYGVNLRPHPGEARGKFFFSIGQAF